MKRANDDEKIMPPMFPRLHVNDTEKGWPRAPPRNKMALYEQFTLPSQRFNHGSSNQGNGTGRNLQFPIQDQPSPPVHLSEKFHAPLADVTSVSTFSSRDDPEKRARDQDDCAVPVLDNSSGMFHSHSNTKNKPDDASCKDPIQNGSCKFSRLSDDGSCLLLESRNGLLQKPGIILGNNLETLRDKGIAPQIRSESPVVLDDDEDDDDGISRSSVVDSMSGLDISPDDVVGMMGQTRFWRARKAIANQQGLFEKQIFELHRLIKVQRLIAGSPHLLVNDSAYLGKSSPAKKLLRSEFVVKPSPPLVNPKDGFEKVNGKIEGYAENALGGPPPISLGRNGNSPSNYEPYSGNPAYPGNSLPVVPSDPAWCFQQPTGHQWLIPVMSPSEGLIYKPYPAPHGFTGTSGCVGCGPLGNFTFPANGFPPVHNYSLPYGVPVMNQIISSPPIDQRTWFGSPASISHASNLSGAEAASDVQEQSSCNLSTEKNETVPQVISSSPGKNGEQDGNATSRGRDRPPLFSKTPTILQGNTQPTSVIRVVPHNARLATESAARIFHSIQEERRQYD